MDRSKTDRLGPERDEDLLDGPRDKDGRWSRAVSDAGVKVMLLCLLLDRHRDKRGILDPRRDVRPDRGESEPPRRFLGDRGLVLKSLSLRKPRS